MLIRELVSSNFSIMAVIIFAAGFARAVVLPYMPIIAIDAIGLSTLQFGALTFFTSIISVIVSLGIGYLSDRMRSRGLLIFTSALMGIFAYSSIWYYANAFVFVFCFALLIPFSSTVFYQSFALAKRVWHDEGDNVSVYFVTLLRGIFTLSWVAGPPIAGRLVLDWPLINVFLLSVIGYTVCALGGVVSIWVLRRQNASVEAVPASHSHLKRELSKTVSPTVLVSVCIVGLIDGALQLHSMTFALYVTRQIGGSTTDVGLMSGALAAVEVLFTPIVAFIIRKVGKFRLVVFFCLLYACYLVLMGLSVSVMQIFLLQILNAAAIAGLFSVSLSFVQGLIQGSPGLSTSLTAVAEVVGAAIGSLLYVICMYFEMLGLAFFGGAALCFLAAGAMSFLPTFGWDASERSDYVES